LLDPEDQGAVILQHNGNYLSFNLKLQLQTICFKLYEFNVPKKITVTFRMNPYNNVLNVVVSGGFSYS
jgi:hypothetical protein